MLGAGSVCSVDVIDDNSVTIAWIEKMLNVAVSHEDVNTPDSVDNYSIQRIIAPAFKLQPVFID
jgi:hypothetical protein